MVGQRLEMARQSRIINQSDSFGLDTIQNTDDLGRSTTRNMGAVFHHRFDLGFVEGEKPMGVEVVASSEEEIKFLVGRSDDRGCEATGRDFWRW